MKKKKIVFTGGGTGGHIFPLVSIIRNLKEMVPEGLDLYYVAPKDMIPQFDFTDEGLKTKYVLAGKIRRYFDPISLIKNLIDVLIKAPIGTFQSLIYLITIYPDLVFSKGGYGSIPVVLAARLIRIPVFLHESDISPGLANRIVSRFASEIFVSFPKTEMVDPKKMILVGNPIREDLTKGDSKRAIERFNLIYRKPVLLVLGGSQGSRRINDTLLTILDEALAHFEIIHQCGEANLQQIRSESQVVLSKELQKYYHLYGFLSQDELADAYKVADLVISRAGSGNIFEITANKKPSILLPLPEAAQNHQSKNASSVAQAGATIVLEEENLTPHFFLEKIKQLFSPPQQLQSMAERAEIFSRPRAGKIVASYIKEYLAR